MKISETAKERGHEISISLERETYNVQSKAKEEKQTKAKENKLEREREFCGIQSTNTPLLLFTLQASRAQERKQSECTSARTRFAH
jgi:hypothetical protein